MNNSNPQMKIEIKKNQITAIIANQEMLHSLMYSLFACGNPKENIDAEIERIEKDLNLINAVSSISLESIIRLARKSQNEEELIKNIETKFSLTNQQAHYIANIEISQL